MPDDSPVLATITEMTAVSISRSPLGARDHVMARLAALIAVGAPAGSYLLHIGTAAEAGITLDDVQGVLIAVAPIVGTPRIASAAAHIAKALGVAIELAEADLGADTE